MAQLVGHDDIESFRRVGRSFGLSYRHQGSYRSVSNATSFREEPDDESALQWAAIERLPTSTRLRSSLIDSYEAQDNPEATGKRLIDVRKLGPIERHMFIEKLIKNNEKDNLRLLQKLKRRVDKVGLRLPTVDVRYKNLSVEAECEVVRGKPLPSIWNSLKGMVSGYTKLVGLKSQKANIRIIKDISGIIKPGRITLVLGPPGCGKTTLLLALSGKLNQSMKVTGEISYNGFGLEEFVPQKTSAYISQYDLHIPEMTVRETIDFSACCQGVGSRAEIMMEVLRREKQAGIVPDPDLDTYMKAISVEGLQKSIQTDYILKILGLDICADTMVGDALRRGVSGGQKKRLTTAEMIVGPTKALFMDEISNGLDSSTTFQVVSYLQQLVHITDATALVALLQPAPETYDLFDDIILMAEGKIVYHGPRSHVLEFFEECGFKCPERKGAADFLQEVISKKDQGQYWYHTEKPYTYVSVDQFSRKFKKFHVGDKLDDELDEPYDRSLNHKDALSFSMYSLTKWQLLKECLKREYLLMKRNSFVYVFKSVQLIIIASVAMTVFLRTRMKVDLDHANDYLGALFFSLVILLVDGFPEVSMTVSRLAVFYKQRDLCFYPAWAYAIPAGLLKVPLSLLVSIVWTGITYYVIGFTPEFGRFIRQMLLLFALHLMSTSMFRFLASVFQTAVASTTAGGLSLMFCLLFGGFIIPKTYMPGWLQWGFWVNPLTYGEIGITVNEFRAPRWETPRVGNTSLGEQTLGVRGLSYDDYFYWISLGALFGMSVLMNIGFTLALSFGKPSGGSPAIISRERLAQLQGRRGSVNEDSMEKSLEAPPNIVRNPTKGGMILPFEPLTLAFENVQYFIDAPLAMKERGFMQKKLQLLHDVTGSFRPGVLTALMGVSGAGKTTLLDVLSGRKTGGTIEGDIRVGGYAKVQKTFARISGYCEQFDIHSPHITVKESVVYSAWLRLSPTIDSNTKLAFVKEVLETIELDGIKDALVGLPGFSGLSTEQRKRLTIAVELVANPSIVFMDEPTSGLDARAAAIVMRAVGNVVNTGRTVVCTIHQPSIDIFEAFDELILMKSGGRIIYAGPLGQHSNKIIEYFQAIGGVQRIKDNYNPATWMLDVTSASSELELGVDFAYVYSKSSLYRANRELVKQLSSPPVGSQDLHFPTRFSQNGWGQFKSCLWKQHLSYWRSPAFNLTRILHKVVLSVLFGLVFWKQGNKIRNQQDLFNIFGFLFSSSIFFGINNCSAVLPFVTTERNVLYREKFAGMYSSWAYSLAQVIIELPYTFIQTLVFALISYPMVGYIWSAYKILWFFYAMFCTLLYYHYLGILLVAMTPNVQVATILASSFFTIFNLFSGFPIPQPKIPGWWVWLYYLTPTSWTLKGLLTSQYGDVHETITVFDKPTTVSAYLSDYFGFEHDHLGIVAIILAAYPVVFAVMFAYCIGKLNFQRR